MTATEYAATITQVSTIENGEGNYLIEFKAHVTATGQDPVDLKFTEVLSSMIGKSLSEINAYLTGLVKAYFIVKQVAVVEIDEQTKKWIKEADVLGMELEFAVGED